MIGLDTNFLLRYLVQDDPRQAAKATEIIESQLSATNPGFVSIVAMVETIWVLGRAHNLGPNELANVVERLLKADFLVVEREKEVATAMVAVRERRGSFSDALIGALGTAAGCAHTVTFDRRASGLPGFVLV